jgi:hypothetical protein
MTDDELVPQAPDARNRPAGQLDLSAQCLCRHRAGEGDLAVKPGSGRDVVITEQSVPAEHPGDRHLDVHSHPAGIGPSRGGVPDVAPGCSARRHANARRAPRSSRARFLGHVSSLRGEAAERAEHNIPNHAAECPQPIGQPQCPRASPNALPQLTAAPDHVRGCTAGGSETST